MLTMYWCKELESYVGNRHMESSNGHITRYFSDKTVSRVAISFGIVKNLIVPWSS